ncbi:MAG: hypothetical protein ABF633_03035 [Clostridium sp.]|uniref:hypothetical protein n=1 Tax=Clostridium sp. TaxID=1506 RepID=UPI0039EBEBAA
MGKRLFDKKVKEIINRKMEALGGEITQEDILKIIRPYLKSEIDKNKLVLSYEKTIANRLMTSFKDDKGIRDCFVVRKKSDSKYVNIGLSKNIEDLKAINKKLADNIQGLKISQIKVYKQQRKLEGQISIKDIVK